MNKKKLVSLCLVLALLITAAVGATFAYFTDNDSVENTFTVGDVDILLDEAVVTKTGDEWTSTNDRTEAGNTYNNIYPGAVLPKDPKVTNTGDHDAWVRVSVTLTSANTFQNAVPEGYDLTSIFDGFVPENWELAAVVDDDDADTLTYTYNYKHRLAAEANTGALFTSVVVPTYLTSADLEAFDDVGFNINVIAEAIQAEGFDNVKAAFIAFDAQ